MENLQNRFPTLITKILENVDDESLVTFKETNREMRGSIVEERFYWIRILKRYNGCFVEFWNSWKMVIEKNSVEMVCEIAVVVEKFFRAPVPFPGLSIPRNTRQWAPLHIAAHRGNLSFFKYIFHKTNNEYPIGFTTALHLAAQGPQLGHLEICQYIVNNTSVDIRITDLSLLLLRLRARSSKNMIKRVKHGKQTLSPMPLLSRDRGTKQTKC